MCLFSARHACRKPGVITGNTVLSAQGGERTQWIGRTLYALFITVMPPHSRAYQQPRPLVCFLEWVEFTPYTIGETAVEVKVSTLLSGGSW